MTAFTKKHSFAIGTKASAPFERVAVVWLALAAALAQTGNSHPAGHLDSLSLFPSLNDVFPTRIPYSAFPTQGSGERPTPPVPSPSPALAQLPPSTIRFDSGTTARTNTTPLYRHGPRPTHTHARRWPRGYPIPTGIGIPPTRSSHTVVAIIIIT
ncbi:hypothetical protein CVT25_006898 [Psilocybe cyanescens]|uniref:Uncharacterized protein n=1 Tax=Psilocybe cyanescens TaxID=93625 RepID=A0A409X5Z2_PSICY|nr:hypothetical protein CVT25_006898 [Psilocybe cyanescens]